jgi:hypothetical protein
MKPFYVIIVGLSWKPVCAFALIAGIEINVNAVFLMQQQADN